MAEALAEQTAALPLVEPGAPRDPVGRSTRDSIRAGIDAATLGAVAELSRRFEAELGRRPVVVATGTGGPDSGGPMRRRRRAASAGAAVGRATGLAAGNRRQHPLIRACALPPGCSRIARVLGRPSPAAPKLPGIRDLAAPESCLVWERGLHPVCRYAFCRPFVPRLDPGRPPPRSGAAIPARVELGRSGERRALGNCRFSPCFPASRPSGPVRGPGAVGSGFLGQRTAPYELGSAVYRRGAVY